VRLSEDPRSSLVNTDGQIFSDCGVPVVLFMENYDISRKGYHDTKDTLENIDLDYGAGGNDERLAQRQAESRVSGEGAHGAHRGEWLATARRRLLL